MVIGLVGQADCAEAQIGVIKASATTSDFATCFMETSLKSQA
jgi:hypothetical protein